MEDGKRKVGCPMKMRTPWGSVVACMLEERHEGNCRELGGRDLTTQPIHPDVRADVARLSRVD